MSSQHYAVSEIFIVIAAVWCVWQYSRTHHWLAAIGTAIFGIAAAIGAYRYGTGQLENLGNAHRWVSQTGGSIAMTLIAFQILREMPVTAKILPNRVLMGVLPIPILAILFFTAVAVPLFMAWLLVGIVGAFMLPATSHTVKMKRTAMVGIMLVNVAVIRQSPMLDPAVSWHVFHTLVAIWLLCVLGVIKTGSAIYLDPESQ